MSKSSTHQTAIHHLRFGNMQTRLDLPDLPTDLFLIVMRYLDHTDFVRCRQLSKSWHREFTDESFLRDVLVKEYRETRDVHALPDLEIECLVDRSSADECGKSSDIWRRNFDRVLAKKRALKSGKPRSVTKRYLRSILTNPLDKQANTRDLHTPVFPWSRNRKRRVWADEGVWIENQIPTDLLETEWT